MPGNSERSAGYDAEPVLCNLVAQRSDSVIEREKQRANRLKLDALLPDVVGQGIRNGVFRDRRLSSVFSLQIGGALALNVAGDLHREEGRDERRESPGASCRRRPGR